MLSNIENSVFFFFNHQLANPVCDAVIKFFMQIPGEYVIIVAGIVALLVGGKYLRFSALVFLSSFVTARYAYKTIKFFIQRPRPFKTLDNVNLLLGANDGFSFPSGHATTSFCLATVIAMRYPKLRWPAFIAAVLVAISRPYAGVHYPSDILGGSLLGLLIGYTVTIAADKCEGGKTPYL